MTTKTIDEILDASIKYDSDGNAYPDFTALKAALSAMVDEIIGEDSIVTSLENPSLDEMRIQAAKLGRNQLRTNQRARKAQWFGEEK